MPEDDAKWLDIPSLTRVPIHVQEAEDMRNMFAGPGWKAFGRIVKAEASKAGTDGLDLKKDEMDRLKAAASFRALLWVLQFGAQLDAIGVAIAPKRYEDLSRRNDPTILDLFAK